MTQEKINLQKLSFAVLKTEFKNSASCLVYMLRISSVASKLLVKRVTQQKKERGVECCVHD